jgi:hypothetical protein
MSTYLDSKIWGSSTWYVMHKIAFSLPQKNSYLSEKTKSYLVRFYTNIQPLLPCPSCQKHYIKTIYNRPPSSHFTKSISVSKWTVNAHNITNKGLNKKIIPFTLASNMYTKHGSIYYNINHDLISAFIFHIIINCNNLINYRKEVSTSFCYLHPCLKCRDICIEYLTNNSLKNVKTNKDMVLWAINLNKLSKKCILKN